MAAIFIRTPSNVGFILDHIINLTGLEEDGDNNVK